MQWFADTRYQRISTHAPVKERLAIVHVHAVAFAISTHAPVKERLGGGRGTHWRRAYFNSRSCEGATKTFSNSELQLEDFNSRSCEGATKTRANANRPKPFQLTLL